MIKTEKLSKKYQDVLAVNEISLHVGKGEIYGFLGLNGAGKTTTIRMLPGMINPTAGVAYIDGKKVHPNHTALWKEIGYLVEIPNAYPDLTVKENLEIIRRMRLISDTGAVNRIIDMLKLTSYTNRKARHLSTGNAQRLGLAKALIHNPTVLILDEPANGLDPAGIFEIRELLTDLAFNKGITIFLSSHILGEISKFANRIGIIHQGNLIQELNTDQLDELCKKKLRVSTRNNENAKSLLIKKNVECLITSEGQIEISDNKYINEPEQISALLAENSLPPILLNVYEEDLESYFLRTIKEYAL